MAVLLIPGLVFFGALVLVALAQTANVTTKAQTEAQQSVWGAVLNQLTGRAYVHAITKATRAAISRWSLAQLKPVTAWFVGLNVLVRDVFHTQAQAHEATAAAVERLDARTTHKALARASAPALKQAKTATAKAGHASAQASSTSKSLSRYQVRTDKRVAHATVAVDVTIPQQLGRIRTREDALSRDQAKLKERTASLENGALRTFTWLRSHPLSAASGVFAGAVAVALNRLGYGFLRCRSWRGVGRRMTCGMGSLLGDLLALGFAYTVVVDPEKIARAALETEDFMESIIRRIAD